MLLIQRIEVFAPEYIGMRDVLVAGEKIVHMSEGSMDPGGLPVEILDGQGSLMTPGLIDSHVHICGGGGEAGYTSRTPEMAMPEMIQAGVTTVVGCLGTDGFTRTMENLVAKVYCLREEGVSAWCYSGSYQIPVRTLTGDITRDILFVGPVIGIGEIALNDHRASAPTVEELARIASAARIGGMLSGKAGIVHCHIGDGKFDLDAIDAAIEGFVLPITQFFPTHMNRNPRLFEKGIRHALRGGMVDLTTTSTPESLAGGEIAAAEGLYRLRQAGVPMERITFTSDGHGSLPRFGPTGLWEGTDMGRLDTLLASVREAVTRFGIPLEEALRPVTSTPAEYLRLRTKGRIHPGKDGDLLLLDKESLALRDVVCRGRRCMENGVLLVKDAMDLS